MTYIAQLNILIETLSRIKGYAIVQEANRFKAYLSSRYPNDVRYWSIITMLVDKEIGIVSINYVDETGGMFSYLSRVAF